MTEAGYKIRLLEIQRIGTDKVIYFVLLKSS